MTAVADVSKRQTDISYKGELQIVIKENVRHKVCTCETCHTTIPESVFITMFMSRGKRNCEVAYYVSIY